MINKNSPSNLDDVIKCPICHQRVVSDANFKDSCALCGMNLPQGKNWPSMTTSKEELKFCCKICLNKYVEIHE